MPGARVDASRLAVVARIAAGVGGGFVLANLMTAALVFVLPLPRGDALMASIIASFVFFLGAIVWAFAARSAAQAWLGLGAVCAICAAVVLIGNAGGF